MVHPKMKHLRGSRGLLGIAVIAALLVGGCSSDRDGSNPSPPSVSFRLETGQDRGRLVYIGRGGTIEGVINPRLSAALGTTVEVVLIIGDGVEHDIEFPQFNAHAAHISSKGSTAKVSFPATKAGEFAYFCSIPGHRAAGMEGKLVVGSGVSTANDTVPAVSVVRDAQDLPRPLSARPPQSLSLSVEAIEVEGQLTQGTTFTYFTFDRKVPGPFLRVRVGDAVNLTLKNRSTSKFIHSIDLHAVNGPGGGATVTQVPPGGEEAFTFKALSPGLYVYHCATPSVAHHIANGMYGLILVEPEGGLPPVDREFYVMQGEIYTHQPFGEKGHLDFSEPKLLNETPEYFVFNGAVGGLTQEKPPRAKVGETVRIYFGVGGPNFTSAFHVIGEVFDRVYDQASLTSPPLINVQTTMVPPGGATMVEFKLDVPGRYILVDHALSRLERGLAGYLLVEGPDNPEVFRGSPSGPASGH